MDKAWFGLIGVIIGVVSVGLKEWIVSYISKKKRADYLAIQIVTLLDPFIERCANVVQDDGYSQGNYQDEIQVKSPDFDPQSLEVDWKSIPSNLMYEILSFPNEIKRADNEVGSVFEYSDMRDTLTERQYQYALLGVKASKIASKLRKNSNIAERDFDNWNPVNFMEKFLKQIEENKKSQKSVPEIMAMTKNNATE